METKQRKAKKTVQLLFLKNKENRHIHMETKKGKQKLFSCCHLSTEGTIWGNCH